ncbi:MAG: acyl-CoA thioesterase [bacterium]
MDHPELEDYPVIKPIEVRWGEMDAFGHVNNVKYFRYFEQARIYYFEAIGLGDMKFDDSVGPILANVSSDFEHPVEYPDTLHFGTRVSEFGQSRFDMEYTAVSESDGVVAARGECVIVTFDFERQKPVRIPDPLKEHILDLEDDLED